MLLAATFLFGAQLQQAALPSPEEVEFFEKQVRPFMSEHCLECHSASAGKTKGGLSMDSREALLQGGDSGPALIPGDPGKSLLTRAARHDHPELKMPPKKERLPDHVLAALAEWVRRGAPDPRTASNKAAGPAKVDATKARSHWAFQPVQKPTLPVSEHGQKTAHPVDALLQAAWKTQGIQPATQADVRTLVRRLSYDLTGLPPTAQEVEAFAKNPSEDAYRSLVWSYLNSQHFGEKWGRHWLDIARYADTRGVPVPITSDPRFLYSYAYRDYVISAFNSDKPLNTFIVEQIAVDVLEPDALEKHTALGFLTLGRTFLNNPHDIIDDRIDVVTRGLLGLTVTCARCHDHKFDPISTADYYALYGIFESSEVPKEPPVIRQREDNPERADYLAKRAEKMAVVEAGLQEEARLLNRSVREKAARYLLGVHECEGQPEERLDAYLGERALVLLPFQKWREKLASASPDDPVLGPWKIAQQCVQAAKEPFSSAFHSQLQTHPSRQNWNPALTAALLAAAPESLSSVAGEYQKLFLAVDDAWRKLADSAVKQKAPLPGSLPDESNETLRKWMEEDGGPLRLTLREVEKAFARKFLERKQKLMETLEVLDGTHPGAPDRAIVLRDKPNPTDAAILIRGNPGNRGSKVPRRFLEVLSTGTQTAYRQGSGRLELARDITHPRNPLTARVYVNRVWSLLFGKPLVSTPADFGLRTPPPVVPELLDSMAFDFMERGWSTKKLIFSIVTSSAYRAASQGNPDAEKTDPENLFIHRMNRKRLSFESLRDTLVSHSGDLDLTMHGRPVVLTKPPFPLRRTVYGFVDRQDLPSVFRAFDFASPDTSTAERFQTTVPQQALFLLNNDFVIERAKALARRLPDTEMSTRLKQLYQLVFQREPTAKEEAFLRQYLEGAPHGPSDATGPALTRWESLCQALLLSNETVFVD